MRNRFAVLALLALLTAGLSFGAQQPAAPKPAAKTPAVKSPAEGQALHAIFQAADPDARIKAAEDFFVKFADSDFRALALLAEAQSYQMKNNYEQMVIYGERALESNPDDSTKIQDMLMLAQGIAQRTREFDLDREEKLGKVEKYANTAMEMLKTLPKPNPNLTDEQWEGLKADMTSQGHDALALAALARKKYDVAIAEFKTALSVAKNPDPATQVRLGATYNLAGQPDNAIALLEKLLATPDLHPQIRQVAQAERARAIQAKGGGAKPATPPPAAAPAPAQPAAPPPAPAPADPKKP